MSASSLEPRVDIGDDGILVGLEQGSVRLVRYARVSWREGRRWRHVNLVGERDDATDDELRAAAAAFIVHGLASELAGSEAS